MSDKKDFKVPITFNPELLVWARLNEGMFLADAADALGISEDELRQYERGEVLPKWSFIQKVAKVYRRPSAIFLRKDTPKDPRRRMVRIVAHYSDGTVEMLFGENPEQE